MTAISPTAATPPPAPPLTEDGRVPELPSTEPTPPGPTTGGSGTSGSLRTRITGWMEEKFGRAAMPIAAVAGGALGGTIGMLTLGPIGAAVGGAGGAFMGALLFMAG